MPTEPAPLPSDLAAAHAMILAERAARREAEDRARNAEAMVSGAQLEIERLRLLPAKARRERFGASSERSSRLIERLELQLAELEETVAEDEAAATERTSTGNATVVGTHVRPRPARRPLPAHLPRQRVAVPPQPLNRPSERYAGEGIALDVSTMADHVGAAAAAALAPIQALIEQHVRKRCLSPTLRV